IEFAVVGFPVFRFRPRSALRQTLVFSTGVSEITEKSRGASMSTGGTKRPRLCNAVGRPVTSGQRESGTGGGFTANRGKRVPGSGAGPGSRFLSVSCGRSLSNLQQGRTVRPSIGPTKVGPSCCHCCHPVNL